MSAARCLVLPIAVRHEDLFSRNCNRVGTFFDARHTICRLSTLGVTRVTLTALGDFVAIGTTLADNGVPEAVGTPNSVVDNRQNANIPLTIRP